MKHTILLVIITLLSLTSCKNESKENKKETVNTEAISSKKNSTESKLKIIPINHATMVLENENSVIYVDPVGGAEAFKGQRQPTLVLITDIHGDHLNVETLKELDLTKAIIVAPLAVSEKLQKIDVLKTIVLENDKSTTVNNITIEAVPMYNLRKEALKYHEKGRGNGYVLNAANERIYISGDTEGIPEMRELKNIDKAFVCMNLPYTMTVENAASTVLEFAPKQVYPYHYRGTDGFSDVTLFKSLVEAKSKKIKVIQLDWYK